MEVLLDSSFIISCIRKRIDFLSDLEEQGFRVKVPREVLQEIKDVRLKPQSTHDDRIACDVALQMIEKRKVKKITLGSGKVDDGLIEKGKEGYYIATLDGGIKNKVSKIVVIFGAKKGVGIE
jgi:rRNA-processing protein FCF1